MRLNNFLNESKKLFNKGDYIRGTTWGGMMDIAISGILIAANDDNTMFFIAAIDNRTGRNKKVYKQIYGNVVKLNEKPPAGLLDFAKKHKWWNNAV